MEEMAHGGNQSSRKSLTTSSDLEDGQKNKQSGATKRNRQLDVVEKCAKAYLDNPQPRRLGKLYAFWYNSKNEPRLVLGPDFSFSLVELAIANGLVGAILRGAHNGS